VSLLGDLPPNVHVVEWVPLGALLETCAGVIHHGGTGTMMTALAAGVPQCVVPQGSYQNVASDVLVERGIGFAADAASLGADECRRLLKDDAMRETAERVRDELMLMPPPAELVPRLVELTR